LCLFKWTHLRLGSMARDENSEKHLSFLDLCECTFDVHLWLCIFPWSKVQIVELFSKNFLWMCLFMLEFFLALKKGSWVKFIKSLKISKLPKPKKISLSMVRIFHFLTIFFIGKNSIQSYLQFFWVNFSKFWCFKWFLGKFLGANPSSKMGLLWSNDS
jgi:hypothetical protein